MSATLGLGAARAVDVARYAIAGRRPRVALRPAAAGEVAEALRAAGRDGLAVLPWGGGTALALGQPPARYDVALDLTAFNRVVEYEPEDFTVTAECGVTLATLRATLAARGQELPLEGARAEAATLGGVLAANASGPRRLRFGAPHDRILGGYFALADGTLARSGGKVVKNVAGYALHRLLCGSRGGLGVLLEASLKLAPGPAARLALLYGATAAEIADPARWARFPRLEPAALTVVGGELARTLHVATPAPAPFLVILGFEAEPAWAERQAAIACEALGEPAARLAGADVPAMWQSLADLGDLPPPRLTFATAGNTPAALAPLLETPQAEGLLFHAPAGRLHLYLDPRAAQARVDALADRGFALIESRGAGEIEPPIARQAGVLALRRRIRAALDPADRFALGARWEHGAARG